MIRVFGSQVAKLTSPLDAVRVLVDALATECALMCCVSTENVRVAIAFARINKIAECCNTDFPGTPVTSDLLLAGRRNKGIVWTLGFLNYN